MSISEIPVVESVQLAIEEINASGGLLGGRKVLPKLADGRSDWPTFASQAETLLADDKVCAVFGCWTSASRKTVRPIFEAYGGLLFYPVQYEGLEQSPNIVYLGAAPNQQIIPAVKWAFDNLGQRFYLVGSDYVFPRAANAVIGDQIKALGGKILGADYIPLGGADVQAVVARIVAAKPDVILNTINGDTNVAFFRALREAGITPAKIPTISFSIGESELPAPRPAHLRGGLRGVELLPDARQSPQRRLHRRLPETLRGRPRRLRSHGGGLLRREALGAGGGGGRDREHHRGPQGDPRPEHGRPRGRDPHRPRDAARVAPRARRPDPGRRPVRRRLGLGPPRPAPAVPALPDARRMGAVPRGPARRLARPLGGARHPRRRRPRPALPDMFLSALIHPRRYLSAQLFWRFFLLSLPVLLAGGVLLSRSAERQIRTQASENLAAIAADKASKIEAYARGKLREVQFLAAQPYMPGLFAGKRDALAFLGDVGGYRNLCLFSTRGSLVFSQHPESAPHAGAAPHRGPHPDADERRDLRLHPRPLHEHPRRLRRRAGLRPGGRDHRRRRGAAPQRGDLPRGERLHGAGPDRGDRHRPDRRGRRGGGGAAPPPAGRRLLAPLPGGPASPPRSGRPSPGTGSRR